jgi:predicted DNA-binding transcriptional regulator YafY
MSINKNAYLRYQVLDRCFSNFQKNYFIEDLLEEVNIALEDFNGYDSNIKKRQLFDDIRFMESDASWAIPLDRIKYGKRVYYRYSEKGFSIKNQKISDEELDSINSALMVLLRFKGLPEFEWVNELVPKLQSLFKSENSPEVIEFDSNEFLRGLEHLPKLYQSIIHSVPLEIEYQSFKDKDPKKLIIHPYYLKQFNKRWFLFGLGNHDKLLYNLPLDRIKGLKNEAVKFEKNTLFNFKEYFDDIIGVSKHNDEALIKIELYIDQELAPYIQTKPLHGSQKNIKENKDGLYIQIEVIPNFELKQMLLSYGDKIEVLSPKNYRNELKKTVDKMMIKYNTK